MCDLIYEQKKYYSVVVTSFFLYMLWIFPVDIWAVILSRHSLLFFGVNTIVRGESSGPNVEWCPEEHRRLLPFSTGFYMIEE